MSRVKIMYIYLFGWLSFFGITASSILFLWNVIQPKQKESRIKAHCTIGKLTIPTIIAHLLSQPLNIRNLDWVIISGLIFYLIIMFSGIVLLYLHKPGWLRYHSRSFHSALVLGLYITIIHHIINVLDLL